MDTYPHPTSQVAFENLYPDSRGHVAGWDRGRLEPRSSAAWSSQALCISVFGTFAERTPERRDSLLNAVLDRAGMTARGIDGSGVEIVCEERAHGAVLNELGLGTPTSLDALIEWPRGLLAIESKFCEPGFGPCSQANSRHHTNPLDERHRRLPNCSGKYEVGSDHKPSTAAEHAACRLTVQDGRRTPRRYWEVAPALFLSEVITPPRVPCPFADDAFQLMRNLEFASEAARQKSPEACFGALIAYVAASPHANTLEEHLQHFVEMLKPEIRPYFGSVTYEQIADVLDDADEADLARWLRTRIAEGLRGKFGAPAPGVG